MSERMRMVLFIAGTIALFTGVSLLVRMSTDFDYTRDHASTRANPWGTKAWRELLERSDIRTETWARPLTDLSDEVEFLAVLDPRDPIAEDERQALVRWVRRGGCVVLAPFADPSASTVGARWTRATMEQVLGDFGVQQTWEGPPEAIVQPHTDGPLTEDVSRVVVPGNGRLHLTDEAETEDRPPPRIVLVDDEDRPAAVAAQYGRGTVVVLAEVEMLSNATLRDADNVVFAANLVFADGPPETVHFDEFHHGFGDDSEVFAGPEVDNTPFRHTALALVAVAAIYAFGRSRRFGAPVVRSETTRRSSADYVRAMAQIYDRGNAAGGAASMLAAGLRRKASRAAGMPASAEITAIAGELDRRSLPGEEIAHLLRMLENADEDLRDAELLSLAQQVADHERML